MPCPNCGAEPFPPEPCAICNYASVPPLTLVAGASNVAVGVLGLRLDQSWARRHFADEARFWFGDWQCKVTRRANDGWYVESNPAAPNETLVNGRAVHEATKLNPGDVLAVGREATGTQRTPVTIQLGGA
jgi:hypothetical protein